jgi:hypothetical protein
MLYQLCDFLTQPLLPKLNAFIDNKVNLTLFLGYDIGKGLVTAVDDVLKFLPQMVEHPRVLAKLKSALEHERLETIRGLGRPSSSSYLYWYQSLTFGEA